MTGLDASEAAHNGGGFEGSLQHLWMRLVSMEVCHGTVVGF